MENTKPDTEADQILKLGQSIWDPAGHKVKGVQLLQCLHWLGMPVAHKMQLAEVVKYLSY